MRLAFLRLCARVMLFLARSTQGDETTSHRDWQLRRILGRTIEPLVRLRDAKTREDAAAALNDVTNIAKELES